MSGNSIPDDYEILRMPNNAEFSSIHSDSMMPRKRDSKDPLPHLPDKVEEDPYMQMDSIQTEIYPNELPPIVPRERYQRPQGGYYPYPESQRAFDNNPYGQRGSESIYRDMASQQSYRNSYASGTDTGFQSSQNMQQHPQNMQQHPQARNSISTEPNYGYNSRTVDVTGRNLPQPRPPDNTPLYGETARYPPTYQGQFHTNQYPGRNMRSPDPIRGPDPNRVLPSGYSCANTNVSVEYSEQELYRVPYTRDNKGMSSPYGTVDLPPPHRGEQRPYSAYPSHIAEKRTHLSMYDSQVMRDYPRYPLPHPHDLPPPRYPQQRNPYAPQPQNDLPHPRFIQPSTSYLRDDNPYNASVYQSVRPQMQTGYNTPLYPSHAPVQRNWSAQYESYERYHGDNYPPSPQYPGQVTPTYPEERPQCLPPPILAHQQQQQQRDWPPRKAPLQYTEEPNPANFPKPRLFPDRQSTIEQVAGDFEHIQLTPTPSPPPRPRTPEPPGWKCPTCTYHNKPTRPGCEMCTTSRPDDYVVPMGYKMDEEELTKQQLSQQHEVEEQERLLLEREKNYQQLMLAADQDLIEVAEEFECSICIVDVDVGDGVRLRECLHAFCRDCLSLHIMHAEDAEVKCPFQGETYQCQSVVTEREIKQLLSPDAYNHWQQMGLNQAEGTIQNAYHCKTADCAGWCVYEDDINFFNCPVCKVQNCLTCKAIHQDKNCKEYQEEIKAKAQNDDDAKQTQKMLEDMIKQGEAMKCPQCHVIIQKKLGCDWIRCTVCKTEICWATKGLRWGPKGKGDTSGGCKCRADGRTPCCPHCKNCH